MGRHWNYAVFTLLLVVMVSGTGLAQDINRSSEGVNNFVRKAFFTSRSSGSLLLTGTCTDNGGVFATLRKTPEGPFKNIDDALTALTKSNPQFTWARDSAGMIRIRDQRAKDDVLRIHLKHAHFKGITNSHEAVRNIISNPSVQEYFKQNHIKFGLVFNSLSGTHGRGTKKLSSDVKDITVGDALDLVIRFFPGLWTYSDCEIAGTRRVVLETFEVGFPAAYSAHSR